MIQAPRLEAIDLWFSYPGGRPALQGVDLRVEPGEFLALVGQNGSGKSSLAMHLNGLLWPDRGRVILDGTALAGLPAAWLATRVGYVFQNPDHQLFSPTVEEELSLGPRYAGWPETEVARQVRLALDQFGLRPLARRGPGTLGFGLRRILSIAAVATLQPAVYVLDEPTRGLDWGSTTSLMDHFAQLNRDGHTVILITHDMRLVARYVSRVVVLSEGRMVGAGTPAEIFRRDGLLQSTRLEPPPIVALVQRLAGLGTALEGLTVERVCESALAWQRQRLG